MRRQSLTFDSLQATRAFAGRLGELLRPGDLLALEGDLGSGKTELARSVVRHLAGAEVEVPSPTFTLVQRYELPSIIVTHMDLYRLCSPSEIAELGWEEALTEGALLVEWPERAGELLPPSSLTLHLELCPARGPEARELELEAAAPWWPRLEPILP